MTGRARAAAVAVAAATAMVAVTGCARTAPHLVFLEGPLWSALDGGSLPDRLAPVGSQVGRRFEVRRARSDETPVRELEEILGQRSYRGVVVGPLLALEIHQIAPMFSAMEFVAIRLQEAGSGAAGAGSASAGLPANLTEIRFARGDGYRDAGRLLAILEPAGTIGIISVWGRDERLVAAFREGYGEGGGSATIDHRRLVSTRDEGEILRLVQDLAGKGVATVLLPAGPMTPHGLRAMRGEGMRAIVSNWGLAGGEASRPMADTVLCSVDDDLAGALLDAFRALDQEKSDGRITGSTVITWGGAAPLPEDAAVYVDRPAGS